MAAAAGLEPSTAISSTVRAVATDVYCVGLGGRTQTNTYLVGDGSAWSLIDAGWAKDASAIAAAAGNLFGAGRGARSILLTHVHPDHAGAARELAHRWDCPILVHPDELPIARGDFGAMARTAGPLDRWLVLPLMRAIGQRRREAIIARSSLDGLARSFGTSKELPGLAGWQWLPTPGHTPGHVSFFRAADGVLITGDAVVTLRVNSIADALRGRQGLSGPPWYTTWNPTVAARSIGELARLEPHVLAGGHGRPLIGPGITASLHELVSGGRA